MDPDRLCPACGYRYGEPNPVRCPECGALAVPWTMRWRPWFVRSGLDLLAWGLPLIMLAPMIVHAVWSPTEFGPRVMRAVTFRLALLPVAMTATGVVMLCQAAQHRRGTSLVLGVVLVLLTAWACASPISREWLVVGPAISPNLRASTVLAYVGICLGVMGLFVLGARLCDLGRALALRVGPPVLVALLLLVLAVVLAPAGDVYAALTRQLNPGMGGGGPAPFNTRAAAFGAADPHARAAAGSGLIVLWCVVLVLRARATWEIERFEPARPRA